MSNYMETKLARSICVLLTANKYRNDIAKFVEFVSLNKSYFPNISDEDLEKLKQGYPITYVEDIDHNEKTPRFVPLDYEKTSRKNSRGT